MNSEKDCSPVRANWQTRRRSDIPHRAFSVNSFLYKGRGNREPCLIQDWRRLHREQSRHTNSLAETTKSKLHRPFHSPGKRTESANGRVMQFSRARRVGGTGTSGRRSKQEHKKSLPPSARNF